MAFVVHTSNRIERLADALARQGLTPAAPDPFQAEWVVVNSRGMESWLRQQVTDRLGVTANLKLPFLQAFLRELARRHPDLAAGGSDTGAFSRGVLGWRIYGCLGDAGHWGAEPAAYVGSGPQAQVRRHQLATKLAALFDEYQVYRPEMLEGWQGGADPDDWQAGLWRHLRSSSTDPTWAEVLGRLGREVDRLDLTGMARVAVFGVNTMPPLFLDLFAALGSRVDVRFFALEASSAPEGSEHVLETAWGTLGRQFRTMLDERGVGWRRDFDEPATETLLGGLQRGILEGRGSPRLTVDAADASVAFHSCHAPLREVEVLHDQLLDLFAKDPTLTPRDVMVMAPDISTYAPHVDSVFGAARWSSTPPMIPYSISDRLEVAESRTFQALVALLELPGSRFKASEVLDLLATPAIHEAFGLAEGDLELVTDWVRRTRIHWAFDDEHRVELDAPPTLEGTWRAGLDRLLAGYAMGPDTSSPSAGVYGTITPDPDVEGGLAVALGKVCEFVTRLRSASRDAAQPRTVPAWREWVATTVLDGFFGSGTNETAGEVAAIAKGLDALADVTEAAGLTEEIPAEVLLEHLNGELGSSSSGGGFFRGRVTFCSLLPMRSIPARVICLLGLDDGAFPRADRRPGFDKVAEAPRLGDRSRRVDDRYLFLEAVLAAREKLLLSFTGRARSDNGRVPPSVLVTELVEAVEAGFELPPKAASLFDGTPLPFGWVEHRLQPFNPEYFTLADTGLFSYSRSNGLGAVAAATGQGRRPTFLVVDETTFPLPPLDADDVAYTSLTPRRLADFWTCPPAFLLRERLGIVPGSDETQPLCDDELTEDEDWLHEWRIGDHILRSRQAGDSPEGCWAWLLGMGWFVDGPAQRRGFDASWDAAGTFLGEPVVPLNGRVESLATLLPRTGGALDLRVSIPSGGLALDVAATVDGVVGDLVLDVRYGKRRDRDRLGALLRHLALAAAGHEITTAVVRIHPKAGRTRPWGTPEVRFLDPLGQDEALTELTWFVDGYREGLARPLPFDLDFAAKIWRDMGKRGADPDEVRRKLHDGEFEIRGGPVARCLGPGGPGPHDEFLPLTEHLFGLLDRLEREVRP